jgi:hypothetical protein
MAIVIVMVIVMELELELVRAAQTVRAALAEV